MNNTVLHASGAPNDRPWIGVFGHKNGEPSQNVIVANSLAMAFVGGSVANNVTMSDNQEILSPAAIFENVPAYDFRLKSGSSPIDSANPLHAPRYDLNGVKRPIGKGPDKGAYESGG